ncbi:hypothetical protein GCM10009430_16170 [Aquimarina litoralis]|uniref:Uncharacterized protein n=1 Tax=Aquimarina litoralis TaxID=584605 RepID=A0ABP3TY82_9FLAO
MGFEYKIITKLHQKQISEVQQLLEQNHIFDKKYEFDNKLFWDFRKPGNKGKMPNISVAFESDGIYICRHEGGFVWKNLENVKTYMESENVSYEILDYQE